MSDSSHFFNKRTRYDDARSSLFDPGELKLGLVDLFGPQLNASSLSFAPSEASCPSGLLASSFYSLRLEHREIGGDLASHDGEERILLFRSDRPGAVGKVIYSSQWVVRFATTDEKENARTIERSDGVGQINSNCALRAKIHVVELKEELRGYDLGSLMVTTAMEQLLLKADERLCRNNCVRDSEPHLTPQQTPTPRILIQLDAEEDTRRHNKLLQFYQSLGFSVKPDAKTQYLNNNDGETIRKISMQRVLEHPERDSRSNIITKPSTFLPFSFHVSDGRRVEPCAQDLNHLDWLIVDNQSGCVKFQSTKGVVFTLDRTGQLVTSTCTTARHDVISSSPAFKLLRLVDVDFVQDSDEAEAPQKESFKALWAFQSPLRTFLSIDPIHMSLFCSKSPMLWECDSPNVRLVCTGDTPSTRKHYRQHLQYQTVAFVEAMTEHYRTRAPRLFLLPQVLDVAQTMPADPLRSSQSGSLRLLCFRTAEAVRRAGHPDWSQLVALVYHLGRVASRFDPDSIVNGYDWSLATETTVVGCPVPEFTKCFRPRHAMDPCEEGCCDSPEGMYSRHCGLDRTVLAFTGPEYLYQRLRHNREVLLPDEGLAMLRYASLVDWHSRGAYRALACADDAEMQPFVTDFYELLQVSEWECSSPLRAAPGLEISEAECEQLWTIRYADLAAKYGMDGILQW